MLALSLKTFNIQTWRCIVDVRNIAIDRDGAKALVYYDSVTSAQRGIGLMRGRTLMGQKIVVSCWFLKLCT